MTDGQLWGIIVLAAASLKVGLDLRLARTLGSFAFHRKTSPVNFWIDVAVWSAIATTVLVLLIISVVAG
ncbi:MAG: hypothetical protein ACRYG4_08805 [Janthinobacterium lividum]